MAAQKSTIEVTSVSRHRSENLAIVEYDEVQATTTMGQKAEDKRRGPTGDFHNALDLLAPFLATPYGISPGQHHSIKPRELQLFRQEADGLETLRCKIAGTRRPEGEDADVKLAVNKRDVTGKLKEAVDVVVEEALAYIGGARGEAVLDLKDREEPEE